MYAPSSQEKSSAVSSTLFSLSNDAPLIPSVQHAFITDDLNIARQRMSQLYVPHKIQCTKGKGSFGLRHERLSLQDIDIGAVSYSAETTVNSLPLKDFFLIQLAQRSTSDIRQNNICSQLKPGTIYIFNPQFPVEQLFYPGYQQINVRIGKAQMEEFLAQELGRKLDRPLVFFQPPLANSENGVALAGFIRFMVREAAIFKNTQSNPRVSRHLLQMLMAMIVSSVPNSYSEAFLENKSGPVPYYLRRVIDYIEEHLTEEITIDKVVEVAGVSPSCLFLAFRNYKDMTPTAYIKNQRLELARRRLLTSYAHGQSVTQIATDCGFHHLSRFASDYRDRFGELPSLTRRKGRSGY